MAELEVRLSLISDIEIGLREIFGIEAEVIKFYSACLMFKMLMT
jgi:hypothetical protein